MCGSIEFVQLSGHVFCFGLSVYLASLHESLKIEVFLFDFIIDKRAPLCFFILLV